MAYTVGNVLTESQALLNDQSGTLFTTATLLPYFQKAYSELQDLLQLADVPVIWTETVATTITAGGGTFTPMPADFFNPIELHEKAVGEADSFYTLMSRVMWLPDTTPGPFLTYWAYLEERIDLNPANANRSVRLRYYKALPTITVVGDTLTVNNAKTYLASRTAALAAFTIGEDSERAMALNEDANLALDRIKRMSIKANQINRTRRRPFASRRGYYY